MKALYYDTYGGPEQLVLRDVPTPALGERDVRVRVHATSLNASDIEFLRGRPAYTRAWGLRRPKFRTLGSDCAGQVEAVGDKVTQHKIGDWVFGDLLERWGGLAEMVVADSARWVPIPGGMSPEVACMLPQAGVVAWQSLQAAGAVANKRILLNGAGGGAGTFALQMAKHLGAGHVTAVDHADKAEQMRRLGADETVDYVRQNYTEMQARYDLIVDFVGSRSLAENDRVLSSGGHYYLVGGPLDRLLRVLTVGSIKSWLGAKKFRLFIHRQSQSDMTQVAALCMQGVIEPQLWRTFTLHDCPQAFQALSEGRVVGKVVVQNV